MRSPRGDQPFRLSTDAARVLAAEFGTPLYVLDEGHFRGRIRRYKAALEASYPKTELAYASKANSTLAVLAIAAKEGCCVDVASEGELRAALAAGVSPSKCHFHGNNKTRDELRTAIHIGVGRIVVDSFIELDLIFHLTRGRPGEESHDLERMPCPDIVLRLAPGVDPITHEKVATGQADTKFGFNIANGAAARAVGVAQALGLPLVGYHCHVGSQLLDPTAQRSGGELIARFAAEMLYRSDVKPQVLDVGGGLGIRYTDDDVPTEIEDYCALVADAVRPVVEEFDLEPTLVHEPGRALIGESGVTLYAVGSIKTVPSPTHGQRTYVAVDGGMSDNPRPALYGARYTVLHVPAAESGERDDEPTLVTIVGKHCETDLLFPDVPMPGSVVAGDLLQVLCTGAYTSSMASNYNRYPRPATVLLRPDGRATLVQRRETWDDLLAREALPDDL